MLKTIFNNTIFYIGLLLVITLNLPYSGQGEVVQVTWSDQSVFLKALQDVLAGKPSLLIENGVVGSGYTTLGVIVTQVTGVSPQAALVLLNRFSFVSTVLVFFLLSKIITRQGLKSINLEKGVSSPRTYILQKDSNLIALIYTITLLFSAHFVSFSDIPWSHFPATLLALLGILYILYLDNNFKKGNSKISLFGLSIFGLTLGLLTQVRSFEGIALSISVIIWWFFVSVNAIKMSGIKNYFKYSVGYLIVVTLSFAVTFYGSLVVTHQTSVPLLYASSKAQNPFAREIFTTYPDNFWVKFVQVFIDPNFFSLNQSYKIKPLIFGFEFDSWRMPFLLQIPSLMYSIPASFLLVIVLVIKRKSKALVEPNILIPILVGSILTLAYICSPTFGSPHLKYGVVRNMMLVSWCFALVASPGNFYRYLVSRDNLSVFLMPIFLPIVVGILYGQILVKSGFIEFNYMHIKEIKLEQKCQQLTCSINVKTYNPKGKPIQPPYQRYIVTGSCPSTGKIMATTLSRQGQPFTLLPCPERYKVDVYPINMGFAGTPEVPISWQFTPPPSQK
ncbi:MAG: hypothetical protein RID09_31085 [Coleofasciculus sp. G1-WW12-02]|uniref:hypothetical protein n=1 Tax=Coleofasciculus sp. G1-WW12-02 TaxID=3068483 RepID=UPI0032F933A2